MTTSGRSRTARRFPYLPFTPDPSNGGVPPQRSCRRCRSPGVNETVALAAEDMKAVIGIYDAGLGARSNETSGKAIMARQREGDVGSFVYQDNWSRAIRHTAVILNDLIPHVYDAERTIRILGEDGREELIRINQAAPGDGMAETERVLNDVTLGAYDVVFQPGPSYSTRREEAREGMNTFMQAAPQAAALVTRPVRRGAGLAERREDRQAAGAPAAGGAARERGGGAGRAGGAQAAGAGPAGAQPAARRKLLRRKPPRCKCRRRNCGCRPSCRSSRSRTRAGRSRTSGARSSSRRRREVRLPGGR